MTTTAVHFLNFVRADSTNLPKVDIVMILTYLGDSSNHNVAEIRGAKALMSSRSTYLETSIGYVEVIRTQNTCIVRAKVLPEHRIRDKPYIVTIQIDEAIEEISGTECDGCAAALGGCKHTMVMMFWLEKRTSEPPPTSVQCYWKKPKLIDARTIPVESKDIFKNSKSITLELKNENVRNLFLQQCRFHKVTDSLLTILNSEKDTLDQYSMFDLMLTFLKREHDPSFKKFKCYIDSTINSELKNTISKKTDSQSNSKLWHNLRQCRITASQLYEAAHCQVDGSLVQQILGGYKVPETNAIKRGKTLESEVRREIEKKLKVTIETSGLMLINGLIGASPDGICNDFVLEIKCPISNKTFKNYVSGKSIKHKYKAQICCQMLAANKNKGLFCVANPKFEDNNKVHMYWVNYDKDFTEGLIKEATNFWKAFIFPKLLHSAKQ